jgi:hypothetical protein
MAGLSLLLSGYALPQSLGGSGRSVAL